MIQCRLTKAFAEQADVSYTTLDEPLWTESALDDWYFDLFYYRSEGLLAACHMKSGLTWFIPYASPADPVPIMTHLAVLLDRFLMIHHLPPELRSQVWLVWALPYQACRGVERMNPLLAPLRDAFCQWIDQQGLPRETDGWFSLLEAFYAPPSAPNEPMSLGCACHESAARWFLGNTLH